jgi:hypothetical protein
MRSKYMLIGVVGMVVGVLLSSAVFVLAGNPDSPSAPGATNSFTLEDIYNRLDTGADGAQSTFTEPGVAPGTGTMHTLNETMSKSPARDDANGATTGEVADGKTFWGLNVAGGEWGLQTGTANVCASPAGVPKTGQTECYKSASPWGTCTCGTADCPSGQDGDLEKGVAWPTPRFTDNGNGTVTDNLTGLIWLRDANCAEGTITWDNALLYSNALYDGCPDCFDNHGDCGLSDGSIAGDWRLPNLKELLSLFTYGFDYDPAVPNTAGTGQWAEGDPFHDVVDDNYYWSSTSDLDGSGHYAWCVDGGSGGTVSNEKGTGLFNKRHVWPVRDP